MDKPETRKQMASRHVIKARRIVARQRAVVRRMRRAGQDSAAAESLLTSFENSLRIFETDLADILRRGA